MSIAELEQPVKPLTADSPAAGVPGEWAWTATFALFGLIVGLAQLSDNSLLTHLATGRWIVDNGGVPREDLYTFTSAGDAWVVQSWFASLLYGVIDAVGGGFGLRLFFGLSTGALAAAVWRLSRPAQSLIPRILLSGTTLVIGTIMWSQRPLLIGLLGLAALLLLVRTDRDLRWLVPIMWVWVNSHGSYPLALVALATMIIGVRLDNDDTPLSVSVPSMARLIEATKWTLVGTILGGVINPYGPKMLLFPLQLLGRSETLQHVNEWKSPSFTELYARAFLGLAFVAILAAARSGKFRVALPVAVFLAAALMGVRNLSVASLVFVAVCAPALTGIGSLRVSDRSRKARGMLVVCASAAFLALLVAAKMTSVDVDRFPVAAVDFLEENDVTFEGERIFHTDTTGNYVGFRYGAEAQVFIDDRFELHSPELVNDYLAVIRGTSRWDEVLDDYAIDIVVFGGTEGPFAQLLLTNPNWRFVFEETVEEDAAGTGSFVACRTSAPVCSSLSA